MNVLEHIEHNWLAIDNIWSILLTNGRFLFIVPAPMTLDGTLDRSIGHYRRYTMVSLREKLEASGFHILHQKYMTFLGAIGGWDNGKAFRKVILPSFQLKIINHLIPGLNY